jgi:hypothetical protein
MMKVLMYFVHRIVYVHVTNVVPAVMIMNGRMILIVLKAIRMAYRVSLMI